MTSDYLLPFSELFDGLSAGVFPGVFLLSRCRWSGLPVEVAILLGPGFSAIILVFICSFYLDKMGNNIRSFYQYAI